MKAATQGRLTFSEVEAGAGLRAALGMTRGDLLGETRASGLRGRGGAGFPTSVKWDLAAAAKGDEKFIVHRPEHGPAAPMLRFDLATDPDETRPLPIGPERAREIDALVDRYLGARPVAPATTDEDVSPELKDRLRALGYAE